MQPWQWICDSLASSVPAMLFIVVDSSGSTPRKFGAKMAVNRTGTAGSIGGGAVETEMIRIARESLSAGQSEPRIYARVHQTAAEHASGMICGGEQTILAYPCGIRDLPVFEQLTECCRLRIPKRLVVSMQGLQLLDANLDPAPSNTGNDSLYEETIGLRPCIYIIGGGHVSLMLSKVLDLLDFDSVVIDEREGIETMHRNEAAFRKQVIPYDEIEKAVPEGPEIFIVIMTHSHHTDALVARSLLKKNVPYVGLLGSRKKIAAIKEALASQLNVDTLKKLHAPVGLPIRSHTPAEIAISIAAELIEFINSRE